MIEGFGVDIVEVKRIKAAAKKFGARFLDKIFTKRELAYCRRRVSPEQHLAARFAAKEAVYKAFGGDGNNPIAWTDVEIINDKHGKPLIVLKGTAKRLMTKRGVKKAVVSLSHTKNYAVGNCILLK
ncbi:MAG: holo-ACP synthase [Candidatus Omnitrophica bacterium]|nr:holo-ACP synthase [Candidatus Omnitrophota bacterium]MDD5310613.1 holo-ACP synthase [Candidatus Omnitrophota bacterium]MDD5545617.1 holo-ACP synthase [Candidatus Omnitrophota bacterium]